MKLHSLKRTPEDKQDDHGAVDGTRPDFPWGARLHLQEDQLDQLGLNTIPVAGATVAVEAIGIVQGYREEMLDGKTVRSLEIQLTDMGLAVQGEPVSKRMYPDKKDA